MRPGQVQSLLTVRQRRRRPKAGIQSSRTRCKICEKTFAKPGLLNRHMLIHTGERPFKVGGRSGREDTAAESGRWSGARSSQAKKKKSMTLPCW